MLKWRILLFARWINCIFGIDYFLILFENRHLLKSYTNFSNPTQQHIQFVKWILCVPLLTLTVSYSVSCVVKLLYSCVPCLSSQITTFSIRKSHHFHQSNTIGWNIYFMLYVPYNAVPVNDILGEHAKIN